MATNTYAEMGKDALIEEVKKRRASGRNVVVDLRSSDDVLRAVLIADDSAPIADAGDSQETSPEKIALLAQAKADGVLSRELPEDLDRYKGKYRYLRSGEIFGLKVLPATEVRANKTHHCKSPMLFWDGTAEEFREQFDKI